jgi:hypothetical protein
MSVQAYLLNQCRAVLVFFNPEYGPHDLLDLPEITGLPPRLPIAPEVNGGRWSVDVESTAAWQLGGVLAVAALKGHREFGDEPDFDCAGETSDCLISISGCLHRAHLALPYGEQIKLGCYGSLGVVLDLAMKAPEQLPVLIARLDAIGYDELHQMAMAAVQGLGSDNLLADLIAEATQNNPGEKGGAV